MADDYSREEMNRLQHDAIRRVQEMNNRARRTLEQNGREPLREENRPLELPPEPLPKPPPHRQESDSLLSFLPRQLKNLNFGSLSSLISKIDSDWAIIIAIGLLLLAEDTDELLLMALIYIMM